MEFLSTTHLFRCNHCGYMWMDEEPAAASCERCHSVDKAEIQQDDGRFGCTSIMNSHALDQERIKR